MQAAEQQQLAQKPSTILLTKIIGKYITAAPIPPLTPLEKLQSLMYGFIVFIKQVPTPERMKELIGSVKKMIDESPNEIVASIKVANAFLRLLSLGISEDERRAIPEEIREDNIEGFYQWFRGNYSEMLIQLGIPYQQETSGSQPSVINVESILRHDMNSGFNSKEEQQFRERLEKQIEDAYLAAFNYEEDRRRHRRTASAYRNAAKSQKGNVLESTYLSSANEEDIKAIECSGEAERQRIIAEGIRETLEEGWTPSFTQFPRKGGYKKGKKSKKTHLNKKRKTRNKNKCRYKSKSKSRKY
jgi:hypothetical protein